MTNTFSNQTNNLILTNNSIAEKAGNEAHQFFINAILNRDCTSFEPELLLRAARIESKLIESITSISTNSSFDVKGSGIEPMQFLTINCNLPSSMFIQLKAGSQSVIELCWKKAVKTFAKEINTKIINILKEKGASTSLASIEGDGISESKHLIINSKELINYLTNEKHLNSYADLEQSLNKQIIIENLNEVEKAISYDLESILFNVHTVSIAFNETAQDTSGIPGVLRISYSLQTQEFEVVTKS